MGQESDPGGAGFGGQRRGPLAVGVGRTRQAGHSPSPGRDTRRGLMAAVCGGGEGGATPGAGAGRWGGLPGAGAVGVMGAPAGTGGGVGWGGVADARGRKGAPAPGWARARGVGSASGVEEARAPGSGGAREMTPLCGEVREAV